MFDSTPVTTYADLLEEVKPLNIDEVKLHKAYELSLQAHKGKFRQSGEPWVIHNLSTAAYIARLNLDEESIIAALLHDVMEETVVTEALTIDQIDQEFGPDVAFIVDGVTSLREHTTNFPSHEVDIEDFRRLIISATEDIRALLVRIAEKIHNMETISALSEEEQKSAAHKAMMIYARLCEYIGLGQWQNVLEAKTFAIYQPQAYRVISNALEEAESKHNQLLNNVTQKLQDVATASDVKVEKIYSRQKSVYSVYKKLKRKYLTEEEEVTEEHVRQLNDLLAVRIIVNTIAECYLLLGMINAEFTTDPEEFDDYIVKPRPNGYQSIHMALEVQGQQIEVQIRTQEMHEYNEYGPASHIAYKQKGNHTSAGDAFNWTKDLLGWKQNTQDKQQQYKIKVFSESVFVFTPKGRVIRLDTGSTALDFAFQIHTDLGYHYRGAKVNGQMVSMDKKLATGDVVEIIPQKHPTVNPDWLNKCKMTSTKYKIRKWLKNREFLHQQTNL